MVVLVSGFPGSKVYNLYREKRNKMQPLPKNFIPKFFIAIPDLQPLVVWLIFGEIISNGKYKCFEMAICSKEI